MDPQLWLVYVLAATGLSLSPGPNGLLALTHGALHGRRLAFFTVAGGALGFVLLIALSMFGIGAVLQASAGWLAALKWLGGAYLVWLGVQVWRAPPIALDVQAPCAEPGAASNARSGIASGIASGSGPGSGPGTGARPRGAVLFRQGLLSALTNPKGLLFFAAFLPQFVDPARSLAVQFVVMAASFAVVEIITEVAIASLAHRISPWLARVGKRFNRACGGVFVAIGAALPLRG